MRADGGAAVFGDQHVSFAPKPIFVLRRCCLVKEEAMDVQLCPDMMVFSSYCSQILDSVMYMILHVAGGKENIPALRLYDKFGFLPVPQGTVFGKPDKDLYVLGHVGQSLQRLCWPALEV